MFLVDALLILAMLFFLFLPVTDRRTVHMKLALICTLLALLSISVKHTRVSQVQLAGVVSAR